MSGEREEGGFIGRWSARKRSSDSAGADIDLPDPGARDAAFRFDVSDDLSRPPGVPEDDARVAVPGSASVPPGQGVVGDERAKTPGAVTGIDPEVGDLPEPPPLTDADMPPVESLDATSDLSGFFSKGVSAALRRTALRHVFAQPSYNVRDGLNDYDGDYTVFEPLGDTVTSDMKFHAARHERERLRREAEAAEAEGKVEVSSADEAEAEGSASDGSAEGRDADTEEAHENERDDRQRPEDGTTSPEDDAVRTAGEPRRAAAAVGDEIDSAGSGERPLNGTRTERTDGGGDDSGDGDGERHG